MTETAFTAAVVLVSFGLGWLARSVRRLGLEKGFGPADFVGHPIPMLVYEWETLAIVAANAAAACQYGYDRREFTGMTVLKLRRPADFAAFHERRRIITESGVPSGLVSELVHVRKDGSEFNVKVSYQILHRRGRKLCLITCVDITERWVAEEQLLEAKKMLETVLNSVPHSVYWKDTASAYVGCNAAFAREVGLATVQDVIGLTDDDMPWRTNSEDMRASDSRAMASPHAPLFYEKRVLILPGNEERWYSQSKVALLDGGGKVFGVLALHEDITRRKAIDLNLALRSRALDACANAVLITRPTQGGNLIEYANPAFERITGYPEDEWIRRDCAFLQRNDREQTGLQAIRRALEEKTEIETTVRNYRRDGTMFLNHLYVGPVRDESGVVTHHIAVINDVTEVTESRDRLHFQANFDALTSLPNRQLFVDRLRATLAKASVFGTKVTVGFVDVDHFKDVNDSLGHSVGDALLQELAVRLKSQLPAGATVARYGGDEFVFFAPEVDAIGSSSDIEQAVSAVFAESVWVDGHELDVDCSVGLCEFPRDGLDVETLTKRADSAMYEAKVRGRNQVCRYDETIGQRVEHRLGISRRLKRAVRNGEFTLAFQPQVDVVERKIVAVEALIRWQDPEVGSVAPSDFIPLAEDSGLIVAIGEWVMTEACSYARKLLDLGHNVRMAVNISARQFSQGGVEEMLERSLARFSVDSTDLELEVTESILTTARFASAIQRIAARGISIAVDDFGTGYSNLSALRTVHPNRIKIDMSLVCGIGASPQDEALVHAVLALAKALGAVVLAEGVETMEQHDFLLAHGCREMQGFLFGRPLNFDALLMALQDPEISFPKNRPDSLVQC
jgi:diguanylate cyclase (GGDEF)-like protein/PAS domain S-box-containing protein